MSGSFLITHVIVFCPFYFFSSSLNFDSSRVLSPPVRYVISAGVRGHLQGGPESAGEPQASDPPARQPGVHSGLYQDHAPQPGPGADGENHQPGQREGLS